MSAPTLTLHGANRCLERGVSLEALEGAKIATPLLNHKSLKFKYKRTWIIARMAGGSPRIISAWKEVR